MLEFEFVDHDNRPQYDIINAVKMIAYFDCMSCGSTLFFSKEYDPIPLHYQSLLKLCEPVTCAKCGNRYRHMIDEDGEDVAVFSGCNFVDPRQLLLFNEQLD